MSRYPETSNMAQGRPGGRVGPTLAPRGYASGAPQSPSVHPTGANNQMVVRQIQSSKAGKGQRPMVVLRREIGDVLRDARQRQGRTLRQISATARVSLGYLSEVERGQKEASSELLASICAALEVPMSHVLREVTERVALAEGYAVPDTVPAELSASMNNPLVGVR